MKSKAAIDVEQGKPLVIDEVDIPDPEPNQVQVKLFSSGVCHTQLAFMDMPVPRPALLGHEGTGVVVTKGSAVDHVKEGDHVIVTWVNRHSPKGPLQRSAPTNPVTYQGKACGGNAATWSEYVLANEAVIVPIPNDVPTDITCIIGCAVLTGAGAVMHTARVHQEQSVVIFGIGGIGVSALQAAKNLNAFPIIAVDLQDAKLEYAMHMGATHVINAANEDPIARVHEITGGGADFAFDAIGVDITAQQIFEATRPGGIGADNHGGMSVLIGFAQGEVPLNMNQMMLTQRTYRGSFGASRPDEDFPMFIRWYQEGKLNLQEMVTDRFKLEEINEAVEKMRKGQILGRGIIEY